MATRVIKESSAVYMEGYSEGLRRALEIVHNEPELDEGWNVKEAICFLVFYPLLVIMPMKMSRIIIRATKQSIARKISDVRAGR